MFSDEARNILYTKPNGILRNEEKRAHMPVDEQKEDD